MSQDERRVFLVQPGDTLVFGNVGQVSGEAISGLSRLEEELRVRVILFVADIDMAAIPGHGDRVEGA